MKKIKAFITTAAIIATSLVAPVSTAFADESTTSGETVESSSWLQVTPVSSRVILRPGHNLEYSMIVSNIGTEKFNYSVYTAPYSIVDEDYNISFSNETNRTQLSRWIQFINEDGTLTDKYKGSLEPGEKHTVNYRITVPDDVPSGGQYATIFAQTDSDDKTSDTSGIKTVSRIGLIVYGRTNGETIDAAEITDYNISGFMNQGPITATAKVKNVGNTDFETKYSFVVKSITGNEICNQSEDSPSNHYNVLPDTERRLNAECDTKTAMGVFWATYKVTALDQVREETKLVIILPVYMIVIMIILLTLLVVWIIMIVRKRKERKARLKV
ncbi:hypothetical protein IJG78_03875 [Candidatus Saccharibacteria bacterium]|nr:hypothetical protein [Candidatus Saccharibacteria bacterium]